MRSGVSCFLALATLCSCGTIFGASGDDPERAAVDPSRANDAAADGDTPREGTGGSDGGANGEGGADANAAAVDKLVYLTKQLVQGDVGVVYADAICTSEGGVNAVAWLSTPTSPALARVTQGRRVRPDGVELWPSLAVLAQGTLPSASLAFYADGVAMPIAADGYDDSVEAWTSTTANGAFADAMGDGDGHCNNWSSNSSGDGFSGTIGWPAQPLYWTRHTILTCDRFNRLICFEL